MRISLSLRELAAIEEISHELSNCVGMVVNHLIDLPLDLPAPLFHRLTTAMELATKADYNLRALMVLLAGIRASAQRQG